MKYCVIDGKQIENKEMLHQTLKEALEFPETIWMQCMIFSQACRKK